MSGSGRSSKGPRPPNAKPDRNREILDRYRAGESQQQLAAAYGISRQRVSVIVRKG
jgi:hypothetical protein